MTLEKSVDAEYNAELEKLLNPTTPEKTPVDKLKSFFVKQESKSKINPADLAPYQLFSGVADDFWFWLNTAGYRQNPALQQVLPKMPDPYVQSNTTGFAGDETLKIGFNVYRLVKMQYEKHVGAFRPDLKVLDYGCGWGRILRFFLKDIKPENLTGIDCIERFIDICKQTNKWSNFQLVNPQGPSELSANSVDLAYACSVFSHISEETSNNWVKELYRVLKPGGLLVVTTWRRDLAEFITKPENHSGLYPAMIKASELIGDLATRQARYDQGEFFHAPVGVGDNLNSSFYGETWIPKEYVQKNWSKYFNFVDFFEDLSYFDQNIIVVRKGQN